MPCFDYVREDGFFFLNDAEYVLESKDAENKDVDSSSLKEHFEKS